MAAPPEWFSWPQSPAQVAAWRAYTERDWLAEDGTMLLNPGEDRLPFPGFTQRTAANDNGILFAVHYYQLLSLHGQLTAADRTRFSQTVRSLEVPGFPGLYHRNPGRSQRLEAHDNFVAIVAGSALFDLPFAREVVEYGRQHRRVYNNLDPEDTGWTHNALSGWRQPGEYAFYQLVAGEAPGLRDFLWLWLSIFEGSFSSRTNASGNLLEWLRIRALMEVRPRAKPESQIYFRMLSPVIWFWQEALFLRTKGEGMHHYFRLYFGGRVPEHPLVPLSQGVLF